MHKVSAIAGSEPTGSGMDAHAVPSGSARPACLLIATGGTIAMKVDPIRQGPVPALSGEDLLDSVPGLAALARLEVNNLSNVPSDYMCPQRWMALHHAVVDGLRRDDLAGIVIAHGTDTLEETAWFLDLTVDSCKPIVLIGAQRNASVPDFDGPRNLLNGVRVCVAREARNKGALIVLNNQINAARDATKTHTCDVEAFKSGDFGMLGRIDEDRVVFSRMPVRRQHLPLSAARLARVDIVAMYAGADGALLRAAAEQGAQGIVVQALGAGNVNTRMFDAIEDTIRSGVQVVISTRVMHGRTQPLYGFVGGGRSLQRAGAIFADDLSPQKARILLMLALQASRSAEDIQQLFDR
jgi:L-asparaginase